MLSARREAGSGLEGPEDEAAGSLVLRRLRHHRHDLADRRRKSGGEHGFARGPYHVAAGNGNATLATARRGCEVTSTDYVESLLARARRRAEAEGLQIQFKVADAENLPFADASFDAVVSTFGAMFSPDQDRTAAELVRVTRPGGRIGLANWTPEGFIGQLFKTIAKHLPPPTGVRSPAVWGTQSFLQSTFGAAASTIAAEPRRFVFRYRSAPHFLDVFRTYYGPVLKAF